MKVDMDLVKQLVGKYLNNLWSIILFVYDDFQFDKTPLINVRTVVPMNVNIAI